jgi:phospholipase C
MPYPITSSQSVAVNQSMTIDFRPAAAGLINVVVVATPVSALPIARAISGSPAVLAGTSPSAPPPPPPPPPETAFTLELFAPGGQETVFTKIEMKAVGTQVVGWGDAVAAASQLAGDWTVKVSNHGNWTTNFRVTIRYQVVMSDLGKVDHIVVVMMENRSFDHMLGYLKLSGRSSDVDGLTGHEFNRDAAGQHYAVKLLTSTDFKTDPGHGWPDVSGPLPGTTLTTSPPPYQLMGDSGASLPSNAGFVQNFALAIKWASAEPPHDHAEIPAGSSRTIRFRLPPPSQKIKTIGARSVVLAAVNQSKSELLGTLTLCSPASSTPLAMETAAIGSGAISLNYCVKPTDQSLSGDWTCEVTNNADSALTFMTDISNSVGPNDPGEGIEPLASIMGYHDQNSVPVYDKLARQFVVCDRWFASIPTDTFPNRLYAMTGGSGGSLTTPADSSVVNNPPRYLLKTIFEVLQEHGVDWNIFFSDLPFALIFKTLTQDAQYTARMRPISEFLDRAATGDLPSMAWLDPNFQDVPDGTDNATDDHPPGDVARGQQFVGQIFNALADSPVWSKTLLVITYDEHGGFYDHVEPPGTPPRKDGPKDDNPNLTRYGLRVPALIVSPWVQQGHVAHASYDHTSILRTILLRFCVSPLKAKPTPIPAVPVGSIAGIAVRPAAAGSEASARGAAAAVSLVSVSGVVGGVVGTIPSMGARTDNANDLGPLLAATSPQPAQPIGPSIVPPTSASRTALSVIAPSTGPRRTNSPVTGFGALLRAALLGF